MRSAMVVLFLLAGVGAAWYWRTSEPPAPGIDTAAGKSTEPAFDALIEGGDLQPELEAVLIGMHQRIDELEAIQASLEDEIAVLRRSLGSSELLLSLETEAGDEPEVAEPAEREVPPRAGRFRRGGGGLTPERLTEAGFTTAQATAIMQRVDEMALERLNLRYQAAREGWLDTPEYRERMGELPDTRAVLESEYGQDAYDRYLYASGRPNRVVVGDVYQGSPAADIGLQPGDMLIELDGQRVYRTDDLLSIAANGSDGASVPLVVQRDGSYVQLYVPRGPLGITARRGWENPE